MSVHKDYPDGCAPSAGPFLILCGEQEKDADVVRVEQGGGCIDVFMMHSSQWLTPKGARELAAALIECADFIDRAAMTTEDKAKDAGDGR